MLTPKSFFSSCKSYYTFYWEINHRCIYQTLYLTFECSTLSVCSNHTRWNQQGYTHVCCRCFSGKIAINGTIMKTLHCTTKYSEVLNVNTYFCSLIFLANDSHHRLIFSFLSSICQSRLRIFVPPSTSLWWIGSHGVGWEVGWGM